MSLFELNLYICIIYAVSNNITQHQQRQIFLLTVLDVEDGTYLPQDLISLIDEIYKYFS